MRTIPLIVLWALSSPAPAAESDVTVEPAGRVVGTATLQVPPATLIANMRDPQWLSRATESKTTVTPVADKGDCEVLDYVSPSFVMTVEYRLERCPSEHGFTAKMITSNAFDTYGTRWTFTDAPGGGTLARYELDATTSLAVPQSWVTGGMRKGVKKMMDALVAWSEAQKGSTTP